METDSDGSQNKPEWSSVLTDAMLSLCVEPWRLLRDVVSATFGRIVARNELFIQASFDAPLEVVFGLKKKDVPEGEEEEETTEKSVSPLQLILSIADGKSKAAQERIAVAGDEDEYESTIDTDVDEHGHYHDSDVGDDLKEEGKEESENDIGE